MTEATGILGKRIRAGLRVLEELEANPRMVKAQEQRIVGRELGVPWTRWSPQFELSERNDRPSEQDFPRPPFELDCPCGPGIHIEGFVFEAENELARQPCSLGTWQRQCFADEISR